MPKTRTQYVCQNCGHVSASYMGRCPNCDEWNTFQEEVIQRGNSTKARVRAEYQSPPRRLSEISDEPWDRLYLPMEEFSRVLGGGIVPGSIVLIGGEPGIGKSTLLLQVMGQMADHVGPTLYVSGEESVHQIKMRAERLTIDTDNLFLVTETDVDTILAHVNNINPHVLVIDSIQTTAVSSVTSAPGNVSQVKACATVFQRLAKETGLPIFLVGHVTKEGTIAGPRVLEHIVDTVLYLEGDAYHTFRLLRGVKNRFGPTSEVGVFEMRGEGLVEVANPSEAFLAERMVNAPGSAIVVTMEGTRPLLAEVQALATPTSFSNPRRTANGLDANRMLLITAVLTRRAGIRLAEQDVFANVIGGLRVDEPAADLAIALAVASSVYDRPLSADMAVVGEVGLSGELRSVGQLAARTHEALKLGFRRIMVPRSIRRSGEEMPDGIDIIAVRSLPEALEVAMKPRD
jgi:DNA repair protein RadA/Sms